MKLTKGERELFFVGIGKACGVSQINQSLEMAARFVLSARNLAQNPDLDEPAREIIKSIIEDETAADEPKVEGEPEEEKMVYPPPRDVLYATVMTKSDEIKYGKPARIYHLNGHSWPMAEHLNEPREVTHYLNCGDSYASPASLPGNPCKGKKTEEPINELKNGDFVKVHKFENVPGIEWRGKMKLIGQTGIIREKDDDGDCYVEFSNFISFWFPKSALELV